MEASAEVGESERGHLPARRTENQWKTEGEELIL